VRGWYAAADGKTERERKEGVDGGLERACASLSTDLARFTDSRRTTDTKMGSTSDCQTLLQRCKHTYAGVPKSSTGSRPQQAEQVPQETATPSLPLPRPLVPNEATCPRSSRPSSPHVDNAVRLPFRSLHHRRSTRPPRPRDRIPTPLPRTPRRSPRVASARSVRVRWP
jgi:hypothetical protein